MLRYFTLQRATRQFVLTKFIHSSRSALAAKIFDMPAMSPTMEEGAIVEWKVKDGENYHSGDTLLDIETDKATISVDAIDDGIMAKILIPNGTKDIKVGTPIAFIAEEGDDLKSLEYPKIGDATAPKKEASAPEPKPKREPTPVPSSAPTSNSTSSISQTSSTKPNPNQLFFPSVEILLHENKISRQDAISKIPATGPHGRILKGDVLAYLGKISQAGNSSIAEFIEKKSHLDLSQIQLREPTKEPSSTTSQSSTTGAPNKPIKEEVKLTHEFVLSNSIPSEILSKLVSKAIEKAQVDSYASKNYKPSDLADPIFEDLIAPPTNAERFKLSYKISTNSNKSNEGISFIDNFDFEPYEKPKLSTPAESLTTVDVELTLNDKLFDSKLKAEVFLEKFGKYLSIIAERYA